MRCAEARGQQFVATFFSSVFLFIDVELIIEALVEGLASLTNKLRTALQAGDELYTITRFASCSKGYVVVCVCGGA